MNDGAANPMWLALAGFVYVLTEVLKHWLALAREERVRAALERAASVQNQKLDAIHAQGNSLQETQLRLTAEALRKVAEALPIPENLASAAAAEKLLYEHRDRQAAADRLAQSQGAKP